MEKVLAEIRRELEQGFRHTFVLTQNLRDAVWSDATGGGKRKFGFPAALCRRLSSPLSDSKNRFVAKYSISQGITLYRDGEILLDQNDRDMERFARMTGLGRLVVVQNRTAADFTSQVENEPHLVLAALYTFLRSRESVNFLVVDNADYLVSSTHGHPSAYGDRATLELLMNWSRDVEMRGTGGCVVLLCPERGSIPQALIQGDGGFRIISVEYPNIEDRAEFLKEHDAPADKVGRLANLTTGFRRIDLEEVIQTQMSEDDIAHRKAELIVARCGDTLELVQSDCGLSQSNAQPHVKTYLEALVHLISENRGSPLIPRGMLFVGVPGNGKSHITRAFARDCGMNMLRFKNMRSMWVGESERNLETVLDLLPSLAPTVVFIDEVDQMLGARQEGHQDGGSQVDSRLLGRLLDFIGDDSHRGEIVWIGATNRPDLLDAAMLRRFDRIFPFMNPTEEARAALLQDLVVRLKIPAKMNFQAVASLMLDFSCDEVEKVLRRAYELCLRKQETQVRDEHMATARKVFKHNYDPTMHEFIALLSVQKSDYVSDLPWYDEDGELKNRSELPGYLQDMVTDTGEMDSRRLDQRVEQLRRDLRGW